ncbi:unnamed protein product [Closterium sp. Yama58-4]|nr:unnamed protein product [Closterium sp. Yama58-4]
MELARISLNPLLPSPCKFTCEFLNPRPLPPPRLYYFPIPPSPPLASSALPFCALSPNSPPLHSPFASFSPPLPVILSLTSSAFPVCLLPAPLAPLRRSLVPSSYTYTSNGFAASLTSAEARRLKRHPAVAAVEEDEYLPALTSSTSFRDSDTFSRLPEDAQSGQAGGQEDGQLGSGRRRKLMTDSPGFLRLPGSLWAANGGRDNAGEGVIVGVIDTGVWPEHPSFADTPSNPYGPVPRRWRGKCQATRDFPKSLCSRKLIGARFFAAGVRKSSAGVSKEKDFMSPRDGDGHGTWCASAAAGNANVPLTLSPSRTLGSISGVAPRARLATYKSLWVTPGGEAGAFQSDIRAAVDAAVSDGVDVLSCSFGGAISRYFNDLPYLQAFKAGVFIAFAAGNSGAPSKGQMLGTLSNTAPFYLTVGASTIGREYQANITLGNGVQVTGLGFGSAGNAINLPLVLSSAAVHPLGTLSLARECFASSLDKSKLSGRMLVCNLKSRDVREAMKDTTTAAVGAAAVLLLSASASSPAPSRIPYTDVPAIHLNAEDSETVRQYLSKATNPTASLSPPFTTFSDSAPSVAYFSSTGPPLNPAFPVTPRLLASNDILKPDIIGPGFQLWAASRGLTLSSEPPKFAYLSGTSMATPHLAGIAALIIQKKPKWSPAQITSAIMTTAYTTNRLGNPIRRTTSSGKKSTGVTVEATPWDMGSGHVDPMRVLNPGLTFDVGYKDYVNFLAGRSYFYTMMNFPGFVGGIRPVKAFNLNRPSIAISRLSRPVVVRRIVKSVADVAATYKAIIRGPSGVKIDVNPMSFTINPGQTQKFSVRFRPKGKPSKVFKFGSLVWRGNQSHIVRIVMAIRTVPVTQFLN